MGKGKGPHNSWVYHVKKAQIIMELHTLDFFLLKRIKKALQMKLPLKIKFIKNRV
jgi:ribosomal protein L16/L10AE